VNEFSKEIEQIGSRKKWISEETIQGAHKIVYEKKEEIKKVYNQSKETPSHEEPTFTKDWID
jgi:hypothetical protein